VHEGATQAPAVHTPLWQSPAPEQVCPVVHLAQPPPPQSVSLSVPFFTPSEHVGVWQTLGVPPQTPLRQSPLMVQLFPLAQLPQLPPQSMSVSVPFFTPSVQEGVWHTLGAPEQTPLTQSVPRPHALPAPQSAQLPPQSTSLSLPFFTVSVQVGA
jgi:hypothetical protein